MAGFFGRLFGFGGAPPEEEEVKEQPVPMTSFHDSEIADEELARDGNNSQAIQVL